MPPTTRAAATAMLVCLLAAACTAGGESGGGQSAPTATPDRTHYITTDTGPVYVTYECRRPFDAAQDTYPRVTEEWTMAAAAMSQGMNGEETVEFATMTAQLHMDLAAFWLDTAEQHKQEAERECSGEQAAGIANLSEMHRITESFHQDGISVCREFAPLATASGAELNCDDLGAHLIDRGKDEG